MSEYRLVELAALSGVSVRNIRAYRERGLVEAPRRVGRTAVYDDRHLAQLRTVIELLRKGFTSAHIAEFLDVTRQGHDLADILGLQQAIFGPPRAVPAVAVDVDPEGDAGRRLLEYGLAEVVGGELTLVDPAIADLLDALATAVARALEESLLARFGKDHVSQPDDVVELRQMIADYRALSRRVVADQLEDALARHLVDGVSDRTGT